MENLESMSTWKVLLSSIKVAAILTVATVFVSFVTAYLAIGLSVIFKWNTFDLVFYWILSMIIYTILVITGVMDV